MEYLEKRQNQVHREIEFIQMKEMHLINQSTNQLVMKENKQKLTLDRLAPYQIKVPGHLNQNWSEWVGGMMIKFEIDDDGLPVTTLTSSFDQAALHGLLRRLYSLGLPLISVICVESALEEER